MEAVYTPGRVTWDTKGLDVLAADNPKVAACRKQGNDFITVRPRQKGKARS
jgi:hypothetical protein